MNYEPVIGIETHIQLKTLTKMFCRCSAQTWQAEPNSHTCPICLGLPGALPLINKTALDQAMLVGLALQMTIAERAHFDRKNYFYPDLAKGYQISQYDQPLNLGGYIVVNGISIGLIRAHLEEDVAKMSHDGAESLIDFNKGGTPLLEIVSEPVMHSAAEAKAYVQALHQLVRYLGVNDGNLEQGSMRADLNISLQIPGRYRYQDGAFTLEPDYQMNNRVEIKNVNSFRAIEHAINHEIKRQADLLDQGQKIIQETRGWDEVKGVSTSQRSKEEAHDYRYFPEPDLPPLEISREWVDEIRARLPELPEAKKARFMADYQLNEYDARLLTEDRSSADWFEQAIEAYKQSQQGDQLAQAKKVANWMLGELARLQNEHQKLVSESELLPAQLASVMYLIDQGDLSVANAKELVAEAFVSGKDPIELIKERGLEQVSGSDDLTLIAQRVIEANPEAVVKYRSGKTSLIMFLVGQMMKETQGRANPAVVKEVLEKLLS